MILIDKNNQKVELYLTVSKSNWAFPSRNLFVNSCLLLTSWAYLQIWLFTLVFGRFQRIKFEHYWLCFCLPKNFKLRLVKIQKTVFKKLVKSNIFRRCEALIIQPPWDFCFWRCALHINASISSTLKRWRDGAVHSIAASHAVDPRSIPGMN